MGCSVGPFNNDDTTKRDVFRLVDKYEIDNFIETGTFKGLTTKLMSTKVKTVYTIEINWSNYQQSGDYLDGIPNIKRYYGGSETKLTEILTSGDISGRIMFYLDAHWGEHNPLFDELSAISNTFADNCIVAIDDCFVPGRDYGCDPLGDRIICFEVLRYAIEKVFPSGYTYFYLNRANLNDNTSGKPSGKLYILPNKWGDHSDMYVTENGVNYSNIEMPNIVKQDNEFVRNIETPTVRPTIVE